MLSSAPRGCFFCSFCTYSVSFALPLSSVSDIYHSPSSSSLCRFQCLQLPQHFKLVSLLCSCVNFHYLHLYAPPPCPSRPKPHPLDRFGCSELKLHRLSRPFHRLSVSNTSVEQMWDGRENNLCFFNVCSGCSPSVLYAGVIYMPF